VKTLLLIVMTWMSLFSSNAFAQQFDSSTMPMYKPSGIKWWTRTGAGDSYHYQSVQSAIQDQFNDYVIGGQHGGWCAGCSLESVVWKPADQNGGPRYELTCHSSVFNQSSYCGVVAPWPSWTCPDSSGSADPATVPGGCSPNNNKGCPLCFVLSLIRSVGNFGDPINSGTGNKYEIKTEYRGTGPFPLDFTWTYNSTGGPNTDRLGDATLGINRTDTYRRRVVAYTYGTSTAAYVARPDGNTPRFDKNGSSWVPATDIDGILTSTFDLNGVVTSWSYRNETNETETYDANGRLQSIADANGYTQTLTYDANGHVATVTDISGRVLIFAYDANNRLISLTRPDGGVLQFAYDANDNLQTVTYPDGKNITYLYNEQAHTSNTSLPNALTGEQDENGTRYSTTTYDTQGRATGTFLASSLNTYSATYTDSTDGSYEATTVVTDPLGKTRTVNFQSTTGRVLPTGYTDSCTGCTSKTGSFSYNTSGHTSLVTDAAGVVTNYTVDTNGLETQRIEAATTSVQRTIQTDWNTSLRKPTERRVYNASSALVSKADWTYNTRGQVLTQTQTDPVTNATRTTTTNYCEQAGITAGTCPIIGLVKSVDGPRTDLSDVTTFTYYQTDDSTCATAPTTCPHRKGDLFKVTNALNQIATFTTYDGAGRVLSMQDPNGVISNLTYNTRGWLTQRSVLAGSSPGAGDHITTYAYDSTGQVTQVIQPDGSYSTFVYDAAHRVTDVADNLSNTIHYTLDNAGNRTKDDTKDPSATLTRTLSRVYDGLGQLQQSLNAQSAATSYTYDADGNPNLKTDALGRVTDQDIDPLNRMIRTLQDANGLQVYTNYSYDARDHLTQVTDPQGLNTIYQYDGLDNLTKLTSPDTGITTYTYDAAGNRATQTDARSLTSTYFYDALNRLTKINVSGWPQDRTFAYDTTQPICTSGETFSIGRLTQLVSLSGTAGTLTITWLCYDRFGNMVHKQTTGVGAPITTRYVYDKAGRVTQIITPTSTTITYTRDAAGRITKLVYRLSGQSTDTTVVSNVTYYPFGPVKQITYANGRTLTRSYDQDYMVSSVLDPASGGLDYTFSRDAVGNLTQLQSAAGNNTFSYDTLDRLTGVNDTPTNNLIGGYAYDGTGNRLSKQTASGTKLYTYPLASHHLINDGSAARTYDAAGNTTSMTTPVGVQNFAFDVANRFTELKSGSTNIKQYDYDARGQRVRKFLGGHPVVVDAVYGDDEAGHLIGDYSVTNQGAITRQHDYLWLDDLPVGVLTGSTGTLAYVEPDHLGTPRAVIDPVRNVAIWKWPLSGNAFGESAPQQDPDGDGTQFVLNLRMPGQYFDAESELSYSYFRDYDVGTGRYVESDPIGMFGGINTYGYVTGDPLSGIDPYGLTKIYGNWCGPDWTGGYKKPWNNLTPEEKQKVKPPIDQLDGACEKHDHCYGKCGTDFPCDSNQRAKCFRNCDRSLTSSAYQTGGFWGNVIGAAIDRPGNRDPGPNCPTCKPIGGK
jgi:RHS repeat-associated protein